MSKRNPFYSAGVRAAHRRLERDHTHMEEIPPGYESANVRISERAVSERLDALVTATEKAKADPSCGPEIRRQRAEAAYVDAVLRREAWAKGLA